MRRRFLGGSDSDALSLNEDPSAINTFSMDTDCALLLDGPFGNLYGASVTDFTTTFGNVDAIEILTGDEAVGCITVSGTYNAGAFTDQAVATVRSGALRLRWGATGV